MSVGDVLSSYVARGVVHNFALGERGTYDFVWLNSQKMRLQWRADKRQITFRDALPDVPARSKMYREVRAFLRDRASPALPAHRRIDPAQFEVTCENRGSRVSIGLKLVDASEEEGTRRLMSMIHETFLFLHDRWPNYMYESFGSPLE